METLPGLEVVRAVATTVRAKSDEGAGTLLEVRFSTFDEWYEINSAWEGNFLERTSRGAFAKTIKENGRNVRALFDHGHDPTVGNKPLGVVESLREEDDSPVGLVRLFDDAAYVRDLMPGLRAGVFGSSFRFRAIKDEWNDAPGVSEWNPKGIPERTVREVALYEFGPVTFPANPASTAKVRSMTDEYFERLRSVDPHRVEELARARQIRTPLTREAAQEGTSAEAGAARKTAVEPPAGHSGGLTPAQRRERLLTMKGY